MAASEERQVRRVIILVIDGLGIGAMPDVAVQSPADEGANTLRTVLAHRPDLELPCLDRLGLHRAAALSGETKAVKRTADATHKDRETKAETAAAGFMESQFGRCALAHPGADSFAGHQEMAGSRPAEPEHQLMEQVGEEIRRALVEGGRTVEWVDETTCLLVDGELVVHDNIEAAPGVNINVTASLDRIPFSELLAVARTVRGAVLVGRVIAVGGRGFTVEEIIERIERRETGQIGVNSAKLGIYDDDFRVQHLGYKVRPESQVPQIAADGGLPVVLIGKTADVITCREAERASLIETGAVFDRMRTAMQVHDQGLIFANVQETDLAGHEEDAARWAELLALVDQQVAALLEKFRSGDLFIFTGDHGNDPGIGHSRHTREFTPCLCTGPGVRAGRLGTRETLADIGATAARGLGLRATEFGTSFFRQLFGRSDGPVSESE